MTPRNLPKRRWFQISPGRFLAMLLAIESGLWLAERCGWAGLGKGLPVVIAMAVAILAVVLLPLWFLASLVLRRRFRFSLRSLLTLALIVAIASSWLGTALRRTKSQREAVEALKRAGCELVYAPGGLAGERRLVSKSMDQSPGATPP